MPEYYSNSDMEFTTSRLSNGNVLFPDKIILTDDGVIVRRPFIYSHKEIYIPYQEVSAITIDTQIVGFASIFIYARGSSISSHDAVIEVHGFLRSEAEQIRRLIIEKRSLF